MPEEPDQASVSSAPGLAELPDDSDIRSVGGRGVLPFLGVLEVVAPPRPFGLFGTGGLDVPAVPAQAVASVVADSWAALGEDAFSWGVWRTAPRLPLSPRLLPPAVPMWQQHPGAPRQLLLSRSSQRSTGLVGRSCEVRPLCLLVRATFAWSCLRPTCRGQARQARTKSSPWLRWGVGMAGGGTDWRRRHSRLCGLAACRRSSGSPLVEHRGFRQGSRTVGGASGACRRPPVRVMETGEWLRGAWLGLAAPPTQCTFPGLASSQRATFWPSGTSCRRIWPKCRPQTTTHPPPPHSSGSSSQGPSKVGLVAWRCGSLSKGVVVSWCVCVWWRDVWEWVVGWVLQEL